MVGDNLISDIEGSLRVGIKNIFFNPEQILHTSKPTFEVSTLREIMSLIK